MTWLREVFGKNKVVIGMVNCPPMPGTPLHDEEGGKGLSFIFERVERDLLALQEGGIDAVLFHNENDRPFVTDIGPEIVATMTRAITQVLPMVQVPFGVDVLWNPTAAIAIAMATGGMFVRDDKGLWITNAGEFLRYRKSICAGHVKCFFNITAELVAHAHRELRGMARSAVSNSLADALCIHGPMAGGPPSVSDLAVVKKALPDTVVFVNNGTRADNVAELLVTADGAIVGSDLKVDGITWNPADLGRVKAYMKAVNTVGGR